MGSLSCLNVSGGDIEITFDTQSAAEAIRAKRMIKDMLRRGYALLIEQEDGTHTRALDFDEKVGKYIVADFDPTIEETDGKQIETQTETSEPTLKKTSRSRRKQIPMEKAKTVAVAPSAGG